MLRPAHLALTLCMSLAAAATAQNQAYLIDLESNVSVIDFDTGKLDPLFNFGISNAAALAGPADGETLYTTDTSGNLYTLDIENGGVTNTANTGLGNIEALSYDNGRLLGLTFGNLPSIYELDPKTGAATFIAQTSLSLPGSARSLTMSSPSTGYVASFTDIFFVEIDTGTTKLLGPHGAGEPLFAMELINGRLFGIASTSGLLYEINAGNGAASALDLEALPGAFYTGMSSFPVPDLPQVIEGDLTPTSTTIDRPRGSDLIGCGILAPDSYNDNQPYDRFQITAIDSAQPVTMEMRSLEPTLADFDPYLAFYCAFDPANPLEGVFLLDDDSGYDGNDATRQNARMEIGFGPGAVGTLIATSYASWSPARYGAYELVITNGIATPFCAADTNGDGFLDTGDITTYVQLFLAGDLAADSNGDGFLDLGDITTFVSLFLAGC